MELTSKINNNILTIKLLESLHLHNAQDFKYFFNSRIENKLDIIIDLSKVSYIDEVGVACLFYCHEVAFKYGSQIYIHKPLNYVKKIMQVMRCYESFEIIDHFDIDIFKSEKVEKKLFAREEFDKEVA